MPYAADDEFVMPARSRDPRGVTPVPVTRLIYKLFVRVAAVPRVRTLCLQCAPWADRMRLLLCYRSDCRAELGGGGLAFRDSVRGRAQGSGRGTGHIRLR